MKVVLVAAIAAAALTMGLGTASASATTTRLCKVNPLGLPCPAAKIYPSGSTFKALGFFEINGEWCEINVDFETKAASGAPLPTEIFLFESLSCPSTIISIAARQKWSSLISVTGTGPSGTATVSGVGGTAVEIDVNLPHVGHCYYELPHFTMFVSGGGYFGGTSTAARTSGSALGCLSTVGVGFEVLPMPEYFVTT